MKTSTQGLGMSRVIGLQAPICTIDKLDKLQCCAKVTPAQTLLANCPEKSLQKHGNRQ